MKKKEMKYTLTPQKIYVIHVHQTAKDNTNDD